MSEITNSERDKTTGRFLAGNGGNGGRKPGSRNKLASEFLDALYADFQVNGAKVIARVAEEQPHQYLKVIASILPREALLDIALRVDPSALDQAESFHQAWQLARQTLGIDHDPLLIEAETTDGS
jgi:hypothetical protein